MAFQAYAFIGCKARAGMISCDRKTKRKERQRFKRETGCGKQSMNYQLLCVDLDGTLLDEKKQLPPENRAAVRQAWESGMEICIASGRGAESAGEYLEEMDIEGNVIALNGGQVVCHGKEIFRTEMTWEIIEPVLQIVEKMNLLAYFNDGEKTLAVNEAPEALQKRLAGNPRLLNSYQVETPESLGKKIVSGKQKIAKISIREDNLDRLEEVRRMIAGRVSAEAAKSDINYLDVFPSGQSKWTGIEKLLAHLHIPAENCVCFGDNENDREMLEKAGLGIAMGNSGLDLKARADFVSLGNDACGVAYGIRTWVLGKKES